MQVRILTLSHGWLYCGGRTCDAAIAKLESVDDITDKYNIEFVKLNNKKYARSLGIRWAAPGPGQNWVITSYRHFPAISFFKAGSMMLYPGDVMETDAVIEFLTNEDALELPDKIEGVDNENLFRWKYSITFKLNFY